ncbi:hypothetical protein [Streptomyces sp. JJ38]|uniref:hypothetical protein n=1 Tax=Streptomyces sp. JJ38 TaxID=2738128 RepID=UPI001C586D4C|nr:hypothetical protein [Streptomyces sp. JJ38]MBW1597449.1 hypothetical protein [Streptomyces sp. JJ38]
MSFDEEWAQLRADTTAEQSTRTRLNQLPPDTSSGGGADGDLAYCVDTNKQAAEFIENHLGPDTHKAGVSADQDTEALTGATGTPGYISPGKLREWEVTGALRDRLDDWQRHARQLDGRLQHELNGLRGANTAFTNQEVETQYRLVSLSRWLPKSPLHDL